MLKADELPKKAVFCRCWRSGKVCERVDLLLFVCSGGVVVLQGAVESSGVCLQHMNSGPSHARNGSVVGLPSLPPPLTYPPFDPLSLLPHLLLLPPVQFPYCDGAHVKHNQVRWQLQQQCLCGQTSQPRQHGTAVVCCTSMKPHFVLLHPFLGLLLMSHLLLVLVLPMLRCAVMPCPAVPCCAVLCSVWCRPLVTTWAL